MRQRQRAQVKIVNTEVLRRLAAGPLDLGEAQPRFDRANDIRRHLVLQIENVVDRTVETVGPDMRAGGGVNQLASDAHAVAGLAHAALEHVTHTKLVADLTQIWGFALVRKTRIARDHKEPRQSRDRRDDLLDDAID